MYQNLINCVLDGSNALWRIRITPVLKHSYLGLNFVQLIVNSSHAGYFSCFCCHLVTFSKINFFKKLFQEHYQRVKPFGSSLSVLIWVQTVCKGRDENSQPFSIRKICRLTPKWRKAISKSLIKGLKSQNINKKQSVYA